MDLVNLALDGQLGSTSRQRLDGVEFRLSVFWLAEVARVPFCAADTPPPPLVFGDPGVWIVTLAQADGTTLISGQPLRNGINVLAGFRGDRRFPGVGFGQLLAWDFTGRGSDPGRHDLDAGSNRRLVYLTAAESG